MKGKRGKKTATKKKATAKPVVVAPATLATKGVIPVDWTREQAGELARTLFAENAVMAPLFHKELNALRERIPPNMKLGVVYAIPPFQPWSDATEYQFVPCTVESLIEQGCPKQVCELFDDVDTTQKLYAIIGCPFREEGEKDRTRFSIYWESGAYVLEECATLTKRPDRYYPTIDKGWSPSTHVGVCGRPGCFARNARFLCTGCRRIFYCGPECQKKHWPRHMIHECKPLQEPKQTEPNPTSPAE